MKKRIWVFFMLCGVFLLAGLGCLLPLRDACTVEEPAPAADAAENIHPAENRVASHWQKMEDNKVWCQLCPHDCIIPDGVRGICRVRENRGGRLYTLVYGRPVAVSAGPIEKAPFHHFHPGHRRRTIATVGCNMRCKHCQNWTISQRTVEEISYHPLSPHEIVEGVLREGLTSVSFTYTEPTVFFEYMYEIAELAQERGLKTTLVTNGFINPVPLRAVLQHLDAVRVDLKAFTETFYRDISGASLAPVLDTLKIIQEEGVHLEIINLVIPTLNDCPDEIREMCEWIKENLGHDVPLHFNRFWPAFRLTHFSPTPIETLKTAAGIAREVGLRFVYIGNLPGHRYDSTFCPYCESRLIHRVGMSVLDNNIEGGRCKFCNAEIPGVWE